MQYIKLKRQVAVYIPTTINKTERISEAEFADRVNEVAGVLSDWFGGATATDGLGYYRAESGELITEPVKVVTSGCNDVNLEKLIQRVEVWRLVWGQESVLLEVDNDKYLVGIEI